MTAFKFLLPTTAFVPFLVVESRYINYDNSAVMTCSPLLYIVPMLSVQNNAKIGHELTEVNVVGLLNY
jgi:hypothetical protein